MFVTEPEAAALYTARWYRDEKEEEFLQVSVNSDWRYP